MEGFMKCAKGHYYSKDLRDCPYCPKQGDSNHTLIGGETENIGSINSDKTDFIGSTDNKTEIINPEKQQYSTFRMGFDDIPVGDGTKTQFVEQVVTNDGRVEQVYRKSALLVGFIVSYTIDKLGTFFPIYEGKNQIGKSAAKAEIVLTTDTTISNPHTLILVRNNKIFIKDLSSTNGTYLNGEDLDPDVSVPLKDGDVFELGKTGKTIFKFKCTL